MQARKLAARLDDGSYGEVKQSDARDPQAPARLHRHPRPVRDRLGCAAYILTQQRLRFPIIEEKPLV